MIGKTVCYISQLKYVFRLEENMSLVLGQNSLGAFHHAKPTGQRSVGIPEENGTTFSD